MDVSAITVDDFKALFRRDFPYYDADSTPACDIAETIADGDIERAFIEARMMFNPSIWGEDDFIKMMYLYLVAHFVATDAMTANGAATPAWTVSSRTVGNVSETYAIPDSAKSNPAFALLLRTSYGTKYLMALLPRMIGGAHVVAGATRP